MPEQLDSSSIAQRLDRDIAAAILVTEDGRYLLQLRDDFPHITLPAHWSLFGGSLEAGESPEIALRRELEEELGMQVSAGRLVLAARQTFPLIDQSWQIHFFEVAIRADDVDGLEQKEGAGKGLFTIGEILNLEKIAPWDLQALLVHARGHILWANLARHGSGN